MKRAGLNGRPILTLAAQLRGLASAAELEAQPARARHMGKPERLPEEPDAGDLAV